MKSKTWVVKLEAEIRNFDEANGSLENKGNIIGFIENALDLSSYGYTLGEFETKIKKVSVRLKK